MHHPSDLVVLSHLRWDSVFQRPHHLLSRLARRHRVFFIEEPRFDDQTSGKWKISRPLSNLNLLVCQPCTPIVQPGFSDEQHNILERLLHDFVKDENVQSPIAWFYTPMAVPLIKALAPQVVVYDCMDALNSFLNAPPILRQREDELLSLADIVFTGGPSLYRRMEGRHKNVHCFPSSVDAAHFAKAKTVSEPVDQEAIPHPRLGYFGVIDERIDLSILDGMAIQHPDWQIVMVGPVMKISGDSLPKRPNIHYLGQRPYAELPAYVGGWDACLMPFARNEATRFISPTKVLEYMAAERPIISTRITDVAEPFSHIVYLADTADEFVAACAEALAEDAEERQRRVALMRRVLSSTSWDLTVKRMSQLLDNCCRSKRILDRYTRFDIRQAALRSNRAFATRRQKQKRAQSPPVVVVGAGPTGLSAAYHLGDDALLLEQNNEIGGWCRSLKLNGFTFDFAGHIMFSNEPYVHEMYGKLLGDNVHWQDREAWIYSKNVYTRYPFQGALYGLPADVIAECIMGAIEAQYGSSKQSAAAQSQHVGASNGYAAEKNGNGHSHANGRHGQNQLKDCCADGILESTAALTNGNHRANGCASKEPANFEEFIYKVWGAGIAKHFAIPYNKKLWAVPLSEMDTSWLGGRVPMPDLREMIEGALRPVPKPMGPNARFGYPIRGGFQALMNGFLPHVEHQLHVGAQVAQVSPRQRLIRLSDGTVIPYQVLISTMPLPVLVRCIGEEAPHQIRSAAAGLRYVSVRCVHLGIGRENVTEKHWVYYPEDTVFHRIFVQGNASPHCNPPGGFGLTCEITYSEHKPLPCDGQALIDRAIADCRKVGIIASDDPIWAATQCDLPHAYVVYDHARPKNVETIRNWLASQDIFLAGRYSEWEYYNSDHAFIAGKKAAETVRALLIAAAARDDGITRSRSELEFDSANGK